MLARALRGVLSPSGSGTARSSASTTTAVSTALRDYERARATRIAPITLRSSLMGKALQMPYAPVCVVPCCMCYWLPL